MQTEWSPPRRRGRWPLIGALLILGAAGLAMMVATPVRRARAGRSRAPERVGSASSEPLPPNVMAYIVEP